MKKIYQNKCLGVKSIILCILELSEVEIGCLSLPDLHPDPRLDVPGPNLAQLWGQSWFLVALGQGLRNLCG